MKNKITIFIFLIFFTSSCGFKPMYKLSESSIDFRSYSVILMNEKNTSREIKEEIKKSFNPISEIEKDYVIEIDVIKNLDPLITNTDGTVAKYRIEIVMNFKVKGENSDFYLIEDMVRGFAQYTVETSEIESDDKKKRMIRTATNNAIQMMISKIQSDISITNDN
tara:strand:- start:544 stop:1038 length:495 start_codon:yes stop_codon:yes gene_type:complete